MQQQQDKTFIVIALVGFGLILGGISLFSWLSTLSGPPTIQISSSEENNRSSTSSSSNKNTLANIKNVPQGLFSYGGSTTWIPVHEAINETIASKFPDFQLRYTLKANGALGSSVGIKMLLDEQLSFSESSRPLKPAEYADAQQRGFQLEQVPIAIDGIAIAVNPGIKIDGLTTSQLQAIYTGAVTNWSELGGPDLPIKAYSKDPEVSGTSRFFLESLLDADAYGDSVEFISETTPALRQVSNDPGGIYYASAPEVVNQCSIYAMPIAPKSQPDNNFVAPFEGTWRTGNDCLDQPNTVNKAVFRNAEYPLTRRLFVVIKANGSREEEAGRAYSNMLLSSEGQALIEQTGFVSIQ